MSNHPYQDIGKWCVVYKENECDRYTFCQTLNSFKECTSLAKYIHATYPRFSFIRIKKFQNPMWKGALWA